MIIQADASTKGWGTYCKGVLTGRKWSKEEKHFHINISLKITGIEIGKIGQIGIICYLIRS